jgi:uncharacterized membrane protein YfcA
MSFEPQRNITQPYVVRAAFLVPIVIVMVAMFQSRSNGAPPFPEASTVGQIAFLLIASGFGIGCYGTLVGIGGGPLIVPVLVFSFGWEPTYIVATSLLVAFLNAFSGTSGYAWQKRIDYEGGLKFSLAAMPGAVGSALIHHFWHVQTFDTIFGLFLLGLALYCAAGMRAIDAPTAARPAPVPESHRLLRFRDRFGTRFRFTIDDDLGVRFNLVFGFLVGFLGIGGGVLQVPLLVYVLRYPVHVATATSHFVTMMTCLFALVPNIFFGNVQFAEALCMGVGVVLGAQAGAWLSPKLRGRGIMWLFVALILVFAVRLLGD